jgi:acyl-CoA dehydrogenase
MDFRLTDEQKMIEETAIRFGKKWGPKMEEIQKRTLAEGVFPQDFWDDFAASGFAGALIPEEYGGSDMGMTALAIAMFTAATYGAGSALLMLTMMDGLCILRAGPDEARQRYLPDIAAGKLKMAFAITEPDAGSNSFRMSTTAVRQGDKIILNGTKTFITGVDVADKVLVIARSMPYEEAKAKGLPKIAGFNVVIVDPNAEGFSKTELNTDGIEGLKQWTLHFDNVEVEQLIGQEHQGVMPMFDVLNAERTLATAQALGMAEHLLQRACDYARERKVFGDRAIGSYQSIQHPLAEIKSELEAVKLLFYKSAAMFDQGASPTEIGPYSTMAKYLAGELAIRAADRALQTYGGNGFDRDYGLIQAYTNARLIRTAPISKEMVLNQVAEHVLRLPRSY